MSVVKDPWLRTLIVLLVIIAASYLAGIVWALAVRFADILLLLVLAWVLAFALEPVISRVEAHAGFKRGLAVALVYVGLLIVLGGATLLMVPVIALQVSQIGTNLPDYLINLRAWLDGMQIWLSSKGINVDAATLLDYTEMARRVESLGPVIVNNALGLATGLASMLFSLVLVLILSFYMVLDGSRLTAAFLQATPRDRRDEVRYLISSTYRAFGGFVRGQLVQAVVYGVGTAAVMMAASLSYTAVTAIFAFAFMMIPFVGPILAIIPPVVIAALIHPDRTWWVFLLLLLLQQVVLNVLAPRLMSKNVGMHPLLVVISLLVGAKLAGAWGAIFAVPVAGVIVAMVGFYRMTVEERERHLQERPEEEMRQDTNSQPPSQQPHGTEVTEA